MTKRTTLLIFTSIALALYGYGSSVEAFNTVNNTDSEIIVHSNTPNAAYTEVVKPHTTSNGWYYTGPAKQITLEVRWMKCEKTNPPICLPSGKIESCVVPPHGQQVVTGSPENGNFTVQCD